MAKAGGERGLTVMGVVFLLCLVVFIVMVISKFSIEQVAASKLVEEKKPQLDTVRAGIQDFLDCEQTLKKFSGVCSDGEALDLISSDGSVLVTKNPPYTSLDNKLELSAQCMAGSVHVLYRGVGSSSEWQDLFDEGGLSCRLCPDFISHDPTLMSCNLAIDGGTIWNLDPKWKSVFDFSDKKARWISSTASVQRADGSLYCQQPEAGTRLVYVKSLSLPAGRYTFEGISSEESQLVLYNANKERVHRMNLGPERSESKARIKDGHYVLQVRTGNFEEFSGLLLSVKDAKGKVVARTGREENWCAFQLSDDHSFEEIFHSGKRCFPCFNP